MEKYDKAGKRNRFTVVKRGNVLIRDEDIALLQYNRIIGGNGLSSRLLHAAWPTKYYNTHQHRLTQLRHDARLLEAGDWQMRTYLPHRNFIWYANSDKANALLKEKGMWVQRVPEASGAHYHDAYQGQVYSSIIEKAKDVGFTVERQDELLGKLERSSHIHLDDQVLKPDITTRLTTPERTILCFDEIDRATEPNRRMDSVGKSWEPKLKAYIHFIEDKKYKEVFPLDREGQYACVLRIWTTDMGNLMSIFRLAEQIAGRPVRFIMGRVQPEFGYLFRPPSAHYEVYKEVLHTASGEPYLFFK